MKIKAGYKVVLLPVLMVMTVALCALPFFAAKERIAVYTTDASHPDTRETGFIRELKLLGYKVDVNPQNLREEETAAIWFGRPEKASEIDSVSVAYKFLYTEEYYPFEWKGLKNPPIVLTPYRDLYEHYTRANIKSALFVLGVNTAEFYRLSPTRKFPLVYYGDNNVSSPLADEVKKIDKAKFLGAFWQEQGREITLSNNTAQNRAKVLSQSGIVAIYSSPSPADTGKISYKVMEAAAAGALVLMPASSATQKIYGNSIIFYNTEEDITPLITYYLNNPNLYMEKTIAAQKITAENLSSAVSARRLKELLDWMHQNDETTLTVE